MSKKMKSNVQVKAPETQVEETAVKATEKATKGKEHDEKNWSIITNFYDMFRDTEVPELKAPVREAYAMLNKRHITDETKRPSGVLLKSAAERFTKLVAEFGETLKAKPKKQKAEKSAEVEPAPKAEETEVVFPKTYKADDLYLTRIKGDYASVLEMFNAEKELFAVCYMPPSCMKVMAYGKKCNLAIPKNFPDDFDVAQVISVSELTIITTSIYTEQAMQMSKSHYETGDARDMKFALYVKTEKPVRKAKK